MKVIQHLKKIENACWRHSSGSCRRQLCL